VTFLLSLALSALSIIIAIPVIQFYGWKIFPGVDKHFLWWMLAIAPIGLLQLSLSSIFLGLQIFKPFNITTVLVPAVTFVTTFILVVAFHMGVAGSLTAYGIGQVTSLAVTVLFLRPVIFSNEPPAPIRDYAVKCITYGYKAHLSNILGYLNYRIDTLLVGFFLGPAAVGVYGPSVLIAEKLWIIATAASGVVLPRLSELNADPEAQQRLTPLIGRWVLVSTLAASIVFAAVGYPLIRLFYGVKFLGIYPLLLWLLPGVILLSVSKVLANDIAARGKIIVNLYLGIVLLVINVVANLLLIPPYGAAGAAGASSIGYLADTSIRLYIYTKMSGNPWYAPLIPQKHDWVLLHKGTKMMRGRLRRGRKPVEIVPEIPIG
jgi:O-antigen/teichoic acid export membrane protein